MAQLIEDRSYTGDSWAGTTREDTGVSWQIAPLPPPAKPPGAVATRDRAGDTGEASQHQDSGAQRTHSPRGFIPGAVPLPRAGGDVPYAANPGHRKTPAGAGLAALIQNTPPFLQVGAAETPPIPPGWGGLLRQPTVGGVASRCAMGVTLYYITPTQNHRHT